MYRNIYYKKFQLRNQTVSDSTNNSIRYTNPADITLSPGYRAEVVSIGLDAPSGMVFSDEGELYIAESGYINGHPRVLRFINGQFELVSEGFEAPISGINYYRSNLYATHIGKITKIKLDGTKQDLISGLPNYGDYWSSNVAFGNDNKIYFGIGTATNSGVVGTDNSWVINYPWFCDHPGTYIILKEKNFETVNMLTNDGERAYTGAFSPYGIPNTNYEVKKGITKAAGSILRANLDGSDMELYAWGLRYPVSIRFDRSNRLFASNQGFEVRGSRPIANAPDEFQLIIQGQWYGWPDFAGGEPVTSVRFAPEGGVQPEFLLLYHPTKPPLPYSIFPSNSYITGFDFNYSREFGPVGDVYIAEFGSGGRIIPGISTPYIGIGHRISKIDMKTGGVTTFAMNKSGFTSSITREGGFGRPVDVKFSPDGSMYVLDMGMNVQTNLSEYLPNTGVIWRISKL